jgi:hypothetical protein
MQKCPVQARRSPLEWPLHAWGGTGAQTVAVALRTRNGDAGTVDMRDENVPINVRFRRANITVGMLTTYFFSLACSSVIFLQPLQLSVHRCLERPTTQMAVRQGSSPPAHQAPGPCGKHPR